MMTNTEMTKKDLFFLAGDDEIIGYATDRGFLREAIYERYCLRTRLFVDELMQDLAKPALVFTVKMWVNRKEMFNDFAEWQGNHKAEGENVA